MQVDENYFVEKWNQLRASGLSVEEATIELNREYKDYKDNHVGMVMEGEVMLMIVDRLDTLNRRLKEIEDVLIKRM